MEIFGMSVAVLIKVILIDLVLSGDNAVVIALAAKNLKPELRNKAILIGTAGAILLRLLFAALIVYLIKIPFLTFIGGVLLIFIAFKLLKNEEVSHKEGGTTLFSAIKVILIADAVMSLDNVLALVGTAHGDLTIVMIGIIISIPIIVFGSSLILKAIDKYPIISYIGAGILAWTAGEMIVGEPRFENFIPNDFHFIIPAFITLLVVGIGYLSTERSKKKATS